MLKQNKCLMPASRTWKKELSCYSWFAMLCQCWKWMNYVTYHSVRFFYLKCCSAYSTCLKSVVHMLEKSMYILYANYYLLICLWIQQGWGSRGLKKLTLHYLCFLWGENFQSMLILIVVNFPYFYGNWKRGVVELPLQ